MTGDALDQALTATFDKVSEVLAETAAALETNNDERMLEIFNSVANAAKQEPDAAIVFTLALLEQAGGILVDLVAAEARLDTGTDQQ
jgi:hypothetical protein